MNEKRRTRIENDERTGDAKRTPRAKQLTANRKAERKMKHETQGR